MVFLKNRVIEQNKKELSCSHQIKKESQVFLKPLLMFSWINFGGEGGECENILCLSSLFAFKDSDMKPYKLNPLLPYPELKMHTSAQELVTN